MDYGIEIGDKVKPADTFDFDNYRGPKGPDDIGVVVGFEDPETHEHTGLVLVDWGYGDGFGGGNAWDHTFGELKGGGDGIPHDDWEGFAVVKVEG